MPRKKTRDKGIVITSTEHLMEGLWQLASAPGAPMPDAFRQGHIDVDGIAFSLRHGGDDDADSLYVYCAFGDIPPGRQEAPALRRLLEINLFLFGDGTPAFCIDETSNVVVFASRLSTDGLQPQRLVQTLGEIASYARTWRMGYFIEGPAEPALRAVAAAAR